MKTALIALAGIAVVAAAAPVEARHYSNMSQCTKYRHGRCVQWKRLTRRQANAYRVGYLFGPGYGYTSYSALPQPLVSRYHLRDRDRYVYQNGNVYVVNPRTYRVIRILNGG
jgi:hypothetical protein